MLRLLHTNVRSDKKAHIIFDAHVKMPAEGVGCVSMQLKLTHTGFGINDNDNNNYGKMMSATKKSAAAESVAWSSSSTRRGI